jgi:hypothetical protein
MSIPSGPSMPPPRHGRESGQQTISSSAEAIGFTQRLPKPGRFQYRKREKLINSPKLIYTYYVMEGLL